MKTGTLCIGAAALVLAAGCNRNDRTGSGSVLDRNNGQQASVTVSGCLQAGEQGLGSREPNAASRSAEGVTRFVLANATSSASSPSRDASQPSTSAPASTGPLYILEGRANELRTHVGQQVEVTGRPDENRSSSVDPNQPNAQTLQVQSVRMINMRCDITQ
ncbi:MAG TPA: hypothetical protein VIR54_02875 [Vicinamibacterales bacterium]